jgi:predicted nucleotidyltransferase
MMTPTEKLKLYKEQIICLVKQYEKKGVINVTIYGSVARNEDTDKSDIDLSFEIDFDTFKFKHFIEFGLDLKNLLGLKIDLYPTIGLKKYVYDDMKEDAKLFKSFLEQL